MELQDGGQKCGSGLVQSSASRRRSVICPSGGRGGADTTPLHTLQSARPPAEVQYRPTSTASTSTSLSLIPAVERLGSQRSPRRRVQLPETMLLPPPSPRSVSRPPLLSALSPPPSPHPAAPLSPSAWLFFPFFHPRPFSLLDVFVSKKFSVYYPLFLLLLLSLPCIYY